MEKIELISTKIINDVTYFKKETTTLKNNICIRYEIDYSPPIKFTQEVGGWIELKKDPNA